MSKPREWLIRLNALIINDRNGLTANQFGDEVPVIEKSAYDAVCKENEKLKQDNLLALIIGDKLADERDEALAELAKLEEKNMFLATRVVHHSDLADAQRARSAKLEAALLYAKVKAIGAIEANYFQMGKDYLAAEMVKKLQDEIDRILADSKEESAK